MSNHSYNPNDQSPPDNWSQNYLKPELETPASNPDEEPEEVLDHTVVEPLNFQPHTMEFLEPSPYTHFSHQGQLHDQLSCNMPLYSAGHAIHNYNMSQQQHQQQQQHQHQHQHQNQHQNQPAPMMSNPAAKTTETKARLGKDEVEVLEREFNKNPKPTTQTKRTFAESMDVELARINNWFQNRRAKSKTERKIELEAAKVAASEQDVLNNYSGQSSPDFFQDHPFLQHRATFPTMNGPPPAVAPCNPQYKNPANASMESLDRTLVVARAGQHVHQQETFGGMMEHHNALSFAVPVHNLPGSDRAQFPVLEEPIVPYNTHRNYSYPSLSTFRPASIPEQQSPEEVCDNTPTPFPMHVPQIMTTFPSELLQQSYDSQSSQCNTESLTHSPEDTTESTYGIGFKYQILESEESSGVPPPPSSLPFRSPPAPMDIASRRKKVHVKPTTLMTETRGRPQLGPRTVSHADGFRRSSDSPMPSPMRRIVSAGGNRNVMSGRIQKSGIESAQRSPMNYGSFPDAGSFIEHNYQNIRNPPTLTAGSSLTSSLAPPTPMSPRDRGMTLKREQSASSESPAEMNFVYSAGGFTHMEGEQMASPPETPQNTLALNNLPSNNGWPSQEFHENWYDIPDEPIYTPALDVFPMELQMPPAYLCNLSQPATPAFGQFQPNLMFNGGSPQFENEQPLYSHSNHSHTEYTFPDSQSNFSSGMFPSPINQQKTFQFSNSTPADFTEK